MFSFATILLQYFKKGSYKNGEDTECGRYEKDQDNSGHVVLSTSMKQTPVSSAVLACFKCGAMCFSKFSRTAKCQVLPGSVLGQYRRAKEAFTFDGPGSTSVFFAAFLVAFLLGASASPVPSTLPSASPHPFASCQPLPLPSPWVYLSGPFSWPMLLPWVCSFSP